MLAEKLPLSTRQPKNHSQFMMYLESILTIQAASYTSGRGINPQLQRSHLTLGDNEKVSLPTSTQRESFMVNLTNAIDNQPGNVSPPIPREVHHKFLQTHFSEGKLSHSDWSTTSKSTFVGHSACRSSQFDMVSC